mgnify:CR=1 FL=1
MKKSLRLRNDCILFSIGGAGYALLEIFVAEKNSLVNGGLRGGTAFLVVAFSDFYKTLFKK